MKHIKTYKIFESFSNDIFDIIKDCLVDLNDKQIDYRAVDARLAKSRGNCKTPTDDITIYIYHQLNGDEFMLADDESVPMSWNEISDDIDELISQLSNEYESTISINLDPESIGYTETYRDYINFDGTMKEEHKDELVIQQVIIGLNKR